MKLNINMAMLNFKRSLILLSLSCLTSIVFNQCSNCEPTNKYILDYEGKWVPILYSVNGIDSISTLKNIHLDTMQLRITASVCELNPDNSFFMGRDKVFNYQYNFLWKITNDSLKISLKYFEPYSYFKDSIAGKENKMYMAFDTTLMPLKPSIDWIVLGINKGSYLNLKTIVNNNNYLINYKYIGKAIQ